MKVGYVRVSTDDQNTARQETLMKEQKVEKIFIDIASGKNTERKELQAMLQFVREGDILVVESYSRLARSTKDLLNILDTLKSKGVEFMSIKEAIDTSTPAGRLMITIFAGLYQFERECSLERQVEGIREARKACKYKGRQPIKIDAKLWNTFYKEWKAENITAVTFYKRLGMSAPTFYRRVREYESGKKIF